MSRDKQTEIKEMAKDLAQIQCNAKGCEDCEFYRFECDDLQHYTRIAELLTTKGYRKADEVAREIFAGIEAEYGKQSGADRGDDLTYGEVQDFFAELKKKYTEGGE